MSRINKISISMTAVIIIVIFIIIVGGAYWLIIKKGEEEFKDWQTYRNEEYGFEIKYPEELILVLEDNSFEIKRNQIDDQPKFIIAINPESWLFKPYLNIVSENNLITEGRQFTKINFEAGNDPTLGCGEKGIKGFTLNLTSIEERQKKDIRLWGSTCRDDFEILETFNQILSTFRFIE